MPLYITISLPLSLDVGFSETTDSVPNILLQLVLDGGYPIKIFTAYHPCEFKEKYEEKNLSKFQEANKLQDPTNLSGNIRTILLASFFLLYIRHTFKRILTSLGVGFQ